MTEAKRKLEGQLSEPKASLRILVVEDNAIIASLIADTLEAMGHEVCALVSTEDESVAAAALHRPDLLLVDVHLKEGSGLSAVERILASGPVAHIFMTGDTLIGPQLDSSAIGLHKPFQDHDLARAIQLALAKSTMA